MNEEISSGAGKKARRIPWGLVIPLILAVAVYVFASTRPPKPLAQGVTVESLAWHTGYKDGTMLIHVPLKPDNAGGEETDTFIETPSLFKIYGSFVFSDLFAFDEWKLIEEKLAGSPLLSIRFGEQHVLDLYEGGRAFAFDGYGGSGCQDYSCYEIPDHVAADLTAYLYEWGDT